MIPNVAPFFLPENKSYRDNRGEFIRIYDSNAENFGPQGENTLLQINVSVNPHQFTLRGMHFQIDGPRENKFIKVISGSIYLVVSNAHNMNRKSELNNYEYQIDKS